MKKYGSLLAVLVLLLGLASLSYAAPAEIPSDTTAVIAKGKTQITLGGELRFRGLFGQNLDVKDKNSYETTTRYEIFGYYWSDENLNGKVDEDEIYFNEGIVKKVTTKKGRNTAYWDYRVRINLEAKVSPNTTGYIELESGTLTTDSVIWGSQNGGARGVYDFGNTKESYVTIRQAWIQYQGSGLFGVPAGVKVGRQLVKLGYGIFYDHTYFGDDAILFFIQPLKELTLAAAHIKWVEENTTLNDDSTGWVLLGSYAGKGFGISADISYVDHQNTPLGDIHLWNFGLRGNVDDIAGTGLNFRADVEFQTGKREEIPGLTNDVKLRGWAALAGLDYKFKTIPLSLTLEYAIGSGDKEDTSDKYEAFITALGQEQHYTFVYEFLAPSACKGLVYGKNRTGLCNTQYVKLGGAYDITKDLKAELYGYWLRAHKAVALNGYTEKDKDLGWEVDAKVTYQIDKGLKYWVEGGYFWPGDAWKISSTRDADDAWAVRHGIQLNF